MRTLAFMGAAAGLFALPGSGWAQQENAHLSLTMPAIRVAGGGLSSLIRRSDVQGALRLGMRQRAALDELFREGTPGRVMVSVRADQGSSPDSLQQQVDEQLRAQLGDHDAKIRAILTAEQWDRLNQLDLQWRGPLAMADTQVAERLKLSRESRNEIAPIAAQYQAVKSEVMASLSQKQEDVSPDGSRRAVMMRINASELEKPLSPARKKLEKAKKEAEAAILAAISDDERSRWNAACGEPFKFRADIKGLRF